MKIHIETKRLILRDLEAFDLQGMFELDSDPAVHRYLGNRPIKTLEDAKSAIAYVRDQYEEHGIGRWAVINKATNEFVGWSGLKYEKYVRKEPYYDLGYRLRKKFWGRGIATETALVSLQYGFQTMNLTEIFAGAHIKNIASNKVLQKVGLTLLETFEYDRMYHHWYGISKEEWQRNSINSE